jgi:hypothetical protein
LGLFPAHFSQISQGLVNLVYFFKEPASINSKWIKDLNIRPKTLQLIHKRAGNTLETIGIGKDFFSRTPAAQQLRERMEKL